MPKSTFITIIVFLFILVCNNPVSAQVIKESFPLQSYNVNQGLSEDYIYSLLEDKNGIIWVGTRNGLDRFNGYTFERIYLEPEILRQEQIRSLLEDKNGNIWIGTNSGLFYKDHETDHIKRIDLNNELIEVDCLFEDNSGTIWVGTNLGILYSYNLIDNVSKSYSLADKTYITHISQEKEDLIVSFKLCGIARFSLKSNRFFYSKKDSEFRNKDVERTNKLSSGNFLISTRSGIFLQNKTKPQEFTNLTNDNPNLKVYTITQINDTSVWIGTDHCGILHVNPLNKRIQKLNLKSKVPIKSVTSILPSKNGLIWIGTTNSGLHVFDPNRCIFEHWEYEKGNPTGLGGNSVLSITELENGDICIGLDGGGVSIYDKTQQLFIHSNIPDIEASNTILQSKIDKSLWIGTFENGLRFAKIKKDKHLDIFTKDTSISINDNIKCIYEDKKGNYWITTFTGVYKHDANFNNHIGIKKVENDLLQIPFYVALEDSNSNLWLGGHNRIVKYQPDKDKTEHVNLSARPNFQVTSFAQTKGACIWVGTKMGLFKIDQNNKDTIQYTVQDGLPSNCVNSILCANNDLWIGTNQGLVQMDIDKQTFRTFAKEDGIEGINFNENAACKGNDGRLYFGTTNGVYSFFPKEIVKNDSPPDIIFTKLELFNKEIKANDDSGILKKTLELTSTINLKHFQNGISLEFMAVNYTNFSKNKYAYQLEGLSQEWINLDNNRKVTWNNLAPGKYILRVKASNNDGIWNTSGRKLEIIIAPPWWRTWWALSIFYLIFILIIVLINRYVLRHYRLKDALKIEKIEKENQIKVNDLKTQFFMNITHEFKTPLTLILGPLEKVISSSTKNNSQKKQLITVYKNAVQLFRLINQLMEFRKIELGKTDLDLHQADLVQFIEGIIQRFKVFAEEKSITVLFEPKPDELIWWFDPEKLEKIICNLLSNALKYSPEFETVTISISTGQNHKNGFKNTVNIYVADNGTGIPKKERDAIFEQFYRLENDSTTGTGIGLSLAKSFVEMHKGTLSVESKTKKGCKFKVQLPQLREIKKEDQIPETEFSGDILQKKVIDILSHRTSPNILLDVTPEKNDRYVILVVEDEKEIREFIVETLTPYFRVNEATNGEEGFQTATKIFPDLIISDVIMPKMNGFELCDKIKSDNNCCHIPIVLLTALSSEEEQIKGLNIGAEDYITKPFNANTLIYKIKTIIENRRKIINRYKTESAIQPVDIVTHSADEKLMEKTVSIIKENISNTDFKVDHLIIELGMSRSAFFRKIKAITLMSPNELIRVIRLKHSAELLLKSDLNISEVSYEVGFVSPKYFRECFKKHFGVTPTEYAQRGSN